jgi:hypothetical protein
VSLEKEDVHHHYQKKISAIWTFLKKESTTGARLASTKNMPTAISPSQNSRASWEAG